MNYCTVPMEIKEANDGSLHYVFCGNQATHAVTNSLWWVCKDHADAMEAEGRWELIPKDEVSQDEQGYTSRCEQIGSLAQEDKRQTECECGNCQGSC